MKINSLLRVNPFFTWAKIAEMTINVYEQVVTPVFTKKFIPLWNRSSKSIINMGGKFRWEKRQVYSIMSIMN